MKWKKLGHIFDPRKYTLPANCHEFAQSPQALVLNDRIRIYFSTRAVDPSNGKFLSHIAYVDMDKKLEQVIGVSTKPVIQLGELGCFDEHGIFPFSPFEDEGKISAYTCGWSRRKSVSVETATGYAESHDNGETFHKRGTGQAFGATLHQPFLVGDSFVRKFDDTYHMWYMFGQKWVRETDQSAPDRVYKIGHATSLDGIDWTPENGAIITDVLHENECQALPTVIYHGGLYHMYFCYRDVFGFRHDASKSYRLGYAISSDLKHWVRDDMAGGVFPSPEGEWDSDMMCYPHIFECDGRVYLLYNGNQFGRYGFGAALLEDFKNYKINTSTEKDIRAHFSACEKSFMDELISRVDMDAYIRKLMEKSTRYEAWVDGHLVGLLAAYHNHDPAGFDFITNVSVTANSTGLGVASHLVSTCIAHANSPEIRLEVAKDNLVAQALYQKFGFINTGEGIKSFHYSLDLRK